AAAICLAPSVCHCPIKYPSTDVSPHGKSSFGLPIRDDAPAARIMTPQAIMEVTSFRGAGDKTCGYNLARVKTNENNEPQTTDNRQPATGHWPRTIKPFSFSASRPLVSTAVRHGA